MRSSLRQRASRRQQQQRQAPAAWICSWAWMRLRPAAVGQQQRQQPHRARWTPWQRWQAWAVACSWHHRQHLQRLPRRRAEAPPCLILGSWPATEAWRQEQLRRRHVRSKVREAAWCLGC